MKLKLDENLGLLGKSLLEDQWRKVPHPARSNRIASSRSNK